MKKLIHDLITLDFFICKSRNKNSLDVASIIAVSRCLKQFIHVLESHRTRKSFGITILCKDPFFLSLINFFISKRSLFNHIKTVSNVYDLKNNSILVIFGNTSLSTENFIRDKMFFNDVFIVGCFFDKAPSFEGGYFIKNSILDYKKIFTVLIILEKALKN